MVSEGKDASNEKSPTGGKRKPSWNVNNKSGSVEKRSREVLQIFDDEVDVDENEADDSDFSDYDFEEELGGEVKLSKGEQSYEKHLFVPKKEEMNGEELDRMMGKCHEKRSRLFGHREDGSQKKRSSDEDFVELPSPNEPTIWKVKCTVGRERLLAFCLMQKFVDLKSLGAEMKIISAFSVDHIKGCIYIEADKQCDINEACKGLSNMYPSRVVEIPKNEVSHLLSPQAKGNDVIEGMWARVKQGRYKGDLAQIVAVNVEKKRATVKLVPRIDLQMLTQKIGGGVSLSKSVIPAPRIISPSELEEFRPIIQYRHDHDTGKSFQILDGMMLQDGYLYKKVSFDSLSCKDVMPLEEELLKFKHSKNNGSEDVQWLTQLYGGSKKKQLLPSEKTGEKGKESSTSSSSLSTNFELYELVQFGRKNFGLIVGMEKDDNYKVLKEGSNGPVVVFAERRTLKNGPSDMKLTALDKHKKTISVGDHVRIPEGSLKDREGVVKRVYRGTLFIYDDNETENAGFFCCKSHICEKAKDPFSSCGEKGGGGDSGVPGGDDFSQSPKSPLSPKRLWQIKDNYSNKEREDGTFSVGQKLRIKVGPLKGFLCSVLALCFSDVTVKLDSQQRVLTVKSEHLSEIRGKNSTVPLSGDAGPSSFSPFDVLGTPQHASMGGTSIDGDGWNAGGLSTKRTSWANLSESSSMLQPESDAANNPLSSINNGPSTEDAVWGPRQTTNQSSSSWGLPSSNAANVSSSCGPSPAWDKSELPTKPSSAGETAGSWGQANVGDSNVSGWGDDTHEFGGNGKSVGSWNEQKMEPRNELGEKEGSGVAERGWLAQPEDQIQSFGGSSGGGWGGAKWGKGQQKEDTSWTEPGPAVAANSSQSQPSNWGCGGSDAADADQDSGWAKKSSWGAAGEGGGGGFRGRGSRGRVDHGGAERGRFSRRGGYRGRGSNRDGFRGRGRASRGESDGWKPGGESSSGQNVSSSSWSSATCSNSNTGGWKSSTADGGGNW